MNQEVEIELLKKEVKDLKDEVGILKSNASKQLETQTDTTVNMKLIMKQMENFESHLKNIDDNTTNQYKELSKKIDDINNKPVETWSKVKVSLIVGASTTVCSAIITFLLTNAFK